MLQWGCVASYAPQLQPRRMESDGPAQDQINEMGTPKLDTVRIATSLRQARLARAGESDETIAVAVDTPRNDSSIGWLSPPCCGEDWPFVHGHNLLFSSFRQQVQQVPRAETKCRMDCWPVMKHVNHALLARQPSCCCGEGKARKELAVPQSPGPKARSG